MKINYWISGASGSWGNELIKQLLEKESTNKIVGYSRGEFAQVQTTRKFNTSKLEMLIGDVRDYDRVKETMKDANIVYHLAALKHLKLCQEQPNECVKTNINGSQNVIRSSLENKVDKCLLISTDKACEPNNIYGTSKYLAEQMFLQANNMSDTKFTVIRAGNVIGSAGSVIPFFIDKAKNGEPLPITDYNMTRYLMTLPDAINLVLRASDNIYGGETFVTKMPAAYIKDVAEVINTYYNIHTKKGKDIYPEIGKIPGEKLDEALISKHETEYTVEDDNFRIILPPNGILNDKYKSFQKMKEPYYRSNQEILNKTDLEKLLIKSSYLR
jgi:UDP-N-acetylglucosamine 4,6-dehydratase/5-epimerase